MGFFFTILIDKFYMKVTLVYLEQMRGSRKFRQGAPDNVYFPFSHQHISQRAKQTSYEKPIASRVFLSKPKGTYDVQGGGRLDSLSPPPGSALGTNQAATKVYPGVQIHEISCKRIKLKINSCYVSLLGCHC